MDNKYNRHNRHKYNLKVHIILVTKYRKQLLKGSIADEKSFAYPVFRISGVSTITVLP